ncbi:MAG: lysophospholipid acyltransferase family protein [Chloroflexi bacterium]|nr:lysophospholipid acyltransferase family protein [Chloroflexota bacterium]
MLKFALFVIALHTLGRLPLPILYRLVSFIADLIYVLIPKLRHNVWDNLRHVMPADATKSELRAAARQVIRNVALYYADLVRMPHMDIDEFFRQRFAFHGFHEILAPAAKAGNGVVILSAHCGNPELAGQGLIPMGVRVVALTEPVKPRRLSALVDRLRSSKGHTFVPVGVGGVRRVMQTLRSGGVVALMGDRDIEGPKARLPFCGVETLMPTGPIEVALRTGATLIPSFSARRNTYIIEVDVEEPLELERTGDWERDVRLGTLKYLERLERRLRADPGQWAVLEKIWDAPEPVPEAAPPAGRKA